MSEPGREMSLDEILDTSMYLHDGHRARKDLAGLRERIAELEAKVARYEAGPEFWDVPPLEDGDTLTGRDVLEMIDNAERLKGDREDGPDGPPTVKLEPYEVVLSRSEYVAMANTVQADRVALWERIQRIHKLESALKAIAGFTDAAFPGCEPPPTVRMARAALDSASGSAGEDSRG